MTSEQQVRQKIRDWVVQKSGKIAASELADDTPIIEQRLIRSVQIPDLILFIEEESGRAIDAEQLKPGVFRNIDTIYRNFFAAAQRDGSGSQES